MPPRPAHIRPRTSLRLPDYSIPFLSSLDPCRLHGDERNPTLRGGGGGPAGWNPWRADEEPGPDDTDDRGLGNTLADASGVKGTASHARGPGGEALVCGSPAPEDMHPAVPHPPGGRPTKIAAVAVVLARPPVAMPRPARACVRHRIDQLLACWGATSRPLQAP